MGANNDGEWDNVQKKAIHDAIYARHRDLCETRRPKTISEYIALEDEAIVDVLVNVELPKLN